MATMSEKRVDPSDGIAYTFEELSAFYKKKYNAKEIAAYWKDECTGAKTPKQQKKKETAGTEYKYVEKKTKPAKKVVTADKAERPLNVGVLKNVAATVAAVGLRCYPKRDKPDLGYGTAGFRTNADILDHVMYRVGVIAALRSRSLGGKAIGVMITASHNPACDNGVKLVDPSGDMLVADWEERATRFANAADSDLAAIFNEMAVEVDAFKGIKGTGQSSKPMVIVGRDTRSSSPALAMAVIDGVGAVSPSSVWSLGLVSTPQLHYVVRCHNTRGGYGVPSIEGYFGKLVGAYKAFLDAVDEVGPTREKYKAKAAVDCANGVGAKVMSSAVPLLGERLQCRVVNSGDGGLNEGCGADFVKVQQKGPAGLADLAEGERGVSFDGDADRIVYFSKPSGGKFGLLDGDRIATLLFSFIAKQLAICGLEKDLRAGIVQTAYANGASTAHVAKQVSNENIVCAKTGVKHLHHEAKDMDVGVYFEANGHGTIMFSQNFVSRVKAAAKVPEKAKASQLLLLLRDIINETVGDAFSDLLAVEAVLYASDMSADEWLMEYTDLPNKLSKLAVKDRGAFETTNAERTCVKPAGLQSKIDELVASAGDSARSFVRPSGTEDVVRIYAEAATTEALEKLATQVAQAVYDLAGGVGERP
eukprot:TRINITY_DN23853_c0_g1_i1.p1 TRINITY_DN23853_c0_g1~~TRINITY_DN23853_c0_g1_i1.p1  ORF type:complete len:687 (+),score=135.35 TRINITY_DN23853_c0_g1_i1:124-2061(+)